VIAIASSSNVVLEQAVTEFCFLRTDVNVTPTCQKLDKIKLDATSLKHMTCDYGCHPQLYSQQQRLHILLIIETNHHEESYQSAPTVIEPKEGEGTATTEGA
jgi:hypothetical protein